MIELMKRLKEDEELNRLKEKYEHLTGKPPFGFNFDEYGSVEEYKQEYRNRIKEYRKTNK